MKWASRQKYLILILSVIFILLHWQNVKMKKKHKAQLLSIAFDGHFRKKQEQTAFTRLTRRVHSRPLQNLSFLRKLSNLDSFLQETKIFYSGYTPPKRKINIDSLEILYQKTELWKYLKENNELDATIYHHLNYNLFIKHQPQDTSEMELFYIYCYAYPRNISNFSLMVNNQEQPIDKFPFYHNGPEPISIVHHPIVQEKVIFKQRIHEK